MKSSRVQKSSRRGEKSQEKNRDVAQLLIRKLGSFIRLRASIFLQRRNFCLRSDIRLSPSGIRGSRSEHRVVALTADRRLLTLPSPQVTWTKKNCSDWRDTLNGVSRQFYSPAESVIALQWYLDFVQVIFATRVSRRIEYHCEAKPCNITSRKGNITLCVSKEYHL